MFIAQSSGLRHQPALQRHPCSALSQPHAVRQAQWDGSAVGAAAWDWQPHVHELPGQLLQEQ
jgi:hypothetical protein